MTILPIHVYSNGINKKLLFKIKDGYQLEWQIPETMKLCGSAKQKAEKMCHVWKYLKYL